MPRRTMILIVCNNTLSKKEEYHTWCEELKDSLREQIVCYDEEYRIETWKKEECEKLLKLATGKDI